MTRKEKDASEQSRQDALQRQGSAPMTAALQPGRIQAQDEPKLLMRVVTWLRDSHALFDYESRQIHKKNLKLDKSCRFVRVENDVKTLTPTEPIHDDQNAKLLFNLEKSGSGDYSIKTDENLEDKLWLVVRAMKNENEKLLIP